MIGHFNSSDSETGYCVRIVIKTLFPSGAGHLAVGAIELALGLYPAPNILLVGAGIAELGVGAATMYEALTAPILPIVDVPSSVIFPALGDVVPLATLFGVCAGYWNGRSLASTTKGGITATLAATAATVAKFDTMTAGFLGPFAGPCAAIATALIVRQVFQGQLESSTAYQFVADDPSLNLFPSQPIMPLIAFPKEPIGQIKDGVLLLDSRAMARVLEGQLYSD